MADPSWLINKLSNPDYNNWVKGNLILQELKTGLVLFLDDKAKDLQKYVLGHVAASSIVCTVCTGNDLRRGRYICPSAGICTTILQVINTEYIHHPPGTVKLMNTNNQAWCDTARYWEIAKAYISAPGYASKTSAAATDCAGLLTIILNCKWIQKFLLINPDVFQQVKDINNAMKHSEDNTMAADQLDKLYDCCIQILQDRHLLSVGSQTALARITEIRHLETLTAALETKLVSQPDPTVSHDTHVSSSEARNPTDRIPMTKGPGLPIEILRMDPKAVELYKTALKEGEVVDHSIRLMIIGHFDVGKTTLARRILGKPVDIQARDSTNGIDVHIHPCKVSLSDQTWHSLQPDEKIDTALKRLAKMIASRNTGEDAPTPTDETKLKTTPAKTESSVGAVGGAKQIVDVQGDEIVYIRENPETINKPSEDKEDTACKEEIKELVAETTETGTFDTGEFASVSLWDFAGQYVFYTTHQMFLSHKAVYLLVTDISKHIGDVVIEDECYVDSSGPKKCTISEFVDFWLNSIHTCFPDGPNVESTVPSVILVGTHADKLTKATVTDDANSSQRGKNREGKASDYFYDVRIHLSKKQTRFHLADEDFDIDNTVIDSKLEDLKKKIVEVAQGLPHWGKRIPAKWLRLETVLWGIKENGLKIVDFVRIKELNGAMSVPISDDELELFLQFHHDSGNILYFSESSLKEKVVLDSKWFVDALKYLITSKTCLKNPHVSQEWVEFSERGILRPKLIDAVWQNDPSFHDNRAHLIALMEKMNLISKPMLWPKDVATPTEAEYYLAPCMLTKTPPEHLLSPSQGKDCETTSILVFYFKKKFVPTAIFHRLLAACLSKWSLCRQGGDDLIFCGCGVFKIEKLHKLTLVFQDFTIQAFVTKVGRQEKFPKEEICIAVLDFLDKSLEAVTGCIATSSLFTLGIKCPKSKNNSVDAITPVSQFQEEGEVWCCCQKDIEEHVNTSVDMLKYWFPCKSDSDTAPLKTGKIIDPWAGLIPQQTPREPLPSNQPTQNQEESFPEYSMTRKPRGPRAGLIPQQTHREPLPSNQPTQHQEELFPEYSMTRKPLDSLLLLYAELKDKLRRDQCRAIAKEISAERHLPAEEKASFQKMTKRRDLVDWVLKYVLKQKDKMIFKIFCESLGKQSPSLGQTLQETPVNKHELMKTERQPTTLQLDDLHFLQSSFNSKLVVDIIIDKLLSQFLITVEEHSSIRNSSDVSEMTKRLEALLQCDKEIMQQFKLITQSFRNASVSETAGWLVPLHAQAKQTLSCDKGLAIATDIYQQIPGIMSPSDLYELYDLIDNSSDVIDRLLKHIYRHPRPEVFDVICYSLEDHDEELYEHFLRLFFFKGCDKEKARPVVNKDSALPSGSGADYLYHILRSRQTLDVVIDHLLSSFCITVDQHSDIRDAVSIKHSITKLVELLEQSPQTIVAVNAILRHLDKVADTKNTGDKEITISVDFGDSEVNSKAKNYMNSLCGQTLPLADIGQFYLNDVIDGSVVIKVSPLDRESLIRFRDMETEGTILEYLSDHIEVFLPDDVEIELSELSIGVKEETTGVPVQSESIINATIQLSSGEVYKMENEPFVQASFQKYSKSIEDIRMCPKELLSRKTESNSLDRGLVFAGRFGSEKGEPLAIKRMLLRNYSGSLKTYETVKERLQHSNIVKIFCVEQDRRYGYVAMELMDETLVEYVVRSCPNGNTAMGTEKEIDYMKHIVTGLAFIHEEGFLHNMFSQGAILLKKKKKDIHPKQVKIACFSDAALCELVPVSCSKGTNDVLALIKVLLFVLNKEEKHVNDVILPDNRIIQSGHFDIFVLLQEILDSRQSDELNLQEFAFHPALSRPSVQLQFLEKSHKLRSELRVDFNSTNRTSVNSMNPWLYEPPLTSNVYQYLISEALHRKYKPHSMNCLVRCIRNCHEHLHNIIPQVQMEFGPRERYIYYWLVKFPGLVSSVYEAMRPHKNHTELIRFFTIES